MIEYVFLRTLVMYYHSVDANFRHLVNDRLLNLMCKVVELCSLSGRDLVFLSETGSLALVVFNLKNERPYGKKPAKGINGGYRGSGRQDSQTHSNEHLNGV